LARSSARGKPPLATRLVLVVRIRDLSGEVDDAHTTHGNSEAQEFRGFRLRAKPR
jgi:hypothetical protein